MNKIKTITSNIVSENILKIKELFPNCVIEAKDKNDKITLKIDFETLKQELSDDIIGENQEKYELTWPGKKESILLANQPTNKILVPCKEESVNWETTQNLYIEGDNLDVLKILRRDYLNKIKLIYIDPPYNTGKNRLYKDKFTHSEWLNMMYPRLKLARDLLTDDGVIFISIDDHEVHNLRKFCDEIFGAENFVCEFVVIRAEGGGLAKQVVKGHDYLLTYAMNIHSFQPLGRIKNIIGKIIEKNGEKYWIQEDCLRKEFGKYGNCYYEEIEQYKGLCKKKEIDNGIENGKYVLMKKCNGMHLVGKLRNIKQDASKFYSVLKHLSSQGVKNLELLNLNDDFSYPKPLSLLKEVILGATFFTPDKEDVVLDFFSGSATTAHAVMQLNAEDDGNRKFIMVQLPEPCNEKSEAFKAGYKNICEIGKERIRRAGKKIIEETGKTDLDVGFKVLKLDSPNMK